MASNLEFTYKIKRPMSAALNSIGMPMDRSTCVSVILSPPSSSPPSSSAFPLSSGRPHAPFLPALQKFSASLHRLVRRDFGIASTVPANNANDASHGLEFLHGSLRPLARFGGLRFHPLLKAFPLPQPYLIRIGPHPFERQERPHCGESVEQKSLAVVLRFSRSAEIGLNHGSPLGKGQFILRFRVRRQHLAGDLIRADTFLPVRFFGEFLYCRHHDSASCFVHAALRSALELWLIRYKVLLRP